MMAQRHMAGIRLLLIAAFAFGFAARGQAEGLPIAGHVEWAVFADIGLRMEARLDTGAAISSIDARSISTFYRNSRKWVRFTVHGRNAVARSVERPVVRVVRVRRAGTPVQERVVVSLVTCLAGITHTTDFTLTDRNGMTYPVLIGRSFLAGRALVDSSRTKRHPPTACP